MKVLFAIGNQQTSKSVIEQYKNLYGDLIEYKDVFYFKALLEEVKKDKDYDRIIINEELEQAPSTSLEDADKFVFNNIDKITDEIEASKSKIIFICSDRRTRSDGLLSKLYGNGIYSILLGDDRSISNLCTVIKSPKTKKEAKEYLRIDYNSSLTVDSIESDETVEEDQLISMRKYYDKLGNDSSKYIYNFDKIAEQYTPKQLKVIAAVLPAHVQDVLRSSDKYGYLFIGLDFDDGNHNKAQQPRSSLLDRLRKGLNNKEEENRKREEKRLIAEKQKEEERRLEKEKQEEMRRIREEKLAEEKRKKEEEKAEMAERRRQEELERENRRKEEEAKRKAEAEQREAEKEAARVKAEEDARIKAEQEIARAKAEEDARIKAEQEIARAKAEEHARIKVEQEVARAKEEEEEAKIKAEQEIARAKAEEEAKIKAEQEAARAKAEEEAKIKAEQEAARVKAELEAKKKAEEDRIKAELEAKKKAEEDRIKEEIEAKRKAEEDRLKAEIEAKKKENENLTMSAVQTSEEYSNYVRTVYEVPKDYKKVVAVVGPNKSGTTFILNAIADNITEKKVPTAILDMTKDKGVYYIYNRDDSKLRKIALDCMKNLSNGIDSFIPVNKYLHVYTSIPGTLEENRRNYKHKTLLETVKRNNNLILMDCDFTTPFEYFEQASEIYIVQDLDILKLQETTMFLRELKSKNIDMSKIRVVINRYVKTVLTPKRLIEGLSYYNDPEMSFVDELLTGKVIYTVVPYSLENYAKYIEGLYKNNISYKTYSQDFKDAIEQLCLQIYPVNGSQTQATKRRGLFG